MHFAFTDEQIMIRDAAETFLREASTGHAVREAMATATGYDPALWQSLCNDLGWPATLVPEAHGGLGLGFVEIVALQEQMGRFLLCAPFFSTVCFGVTALRIVGNAAQQAAWLPQLNSGTTATLAFAGESTGRNGGDWSVATVDAIWEPLDNGYALNGTLKYVIDGASSDLLIVAARKPGSQGADGISLFLLPADTAGVERRALPTMDQTRKQADILLHDVRVSAAAVLGEAGNSGAILQTILDLATIALAAEQLGGAQTSLDMAVAYAKERVQFGRSIASFQAIKHKAADMMTRVEVARSGVYYAACIAQAALEAAEGKPSELANELAEAASIAKAQCSDTYFKNAADALQLHGGVGFTWEYDVHLHFKRAKASEHYLGNGAWHRERIASIILDGASETTGA
ncbi:MAG TPA: acyl-CoA dehydrogenase family protein, partial [Dongiaceae bacterium]|nr:acyl-CoA dehydrogenase family protein [Dongiaceae bacterium]